MTAEILACKQQQISPLFTLPLPLSYVNTSKEQRIGFGTEKH